jgi:alcohol dehydrogenase
MTGIDLLMQRGTTDVARSYFMHALVYHGPGQKSWESRPLPQLQTGNDAIVRITTTTICGTDLHILKGDVPTVEPGRILGHEGVGIVEEVGNNVTSLSPGDKVLISCISSCSRCDACRRGMPSHCDAGGWILGHRIDGTQAEYVRIPFADTSVYRVPHDADEEAITLLSDILPTGFECGVLNGEIKPGDRIAIVGAGPIGLATLLTAQFYSPAGIAMIDTDSNRLETAHSLGATHLVRGGPDAAGDVLAWTAGAGVDVAIEAVGIPETFDLCQAIIAPGGRIANVGVHGRSVTLHLERLWSHNITIRTRLVDTGTTAMLLQRVQSGKLDPRPLVTHWFRLAEIEQAYETFTHAARERALKVLLKGRA